MNIGDMSLCELVAALDGKELSSVELVSHCLERIRENARLNNYITVCGENALSAAADADRRRARGEVLPLLGVPIAVKDNIAVAGVRSTFASAFSKDYIPSEDAAVVEKLRAVGAIIIGKTNMDEFAFGSSNEYSAFGCVKNVRNESRVPGGSSGGSANTVAACEVPAALGTDTGGSVRQPAAFCGVVGLKPTYSSISRRGLMGPPSFEQVGTLTRNCDDALAVFNAIADKTSGNEEPVSAIERNNCKLNGNIAGKTIGIALEFLDARFSSAAVMREFLRTIERLEDLGATIKELFIPSFEAALAAYHVLSSAEAASVFDRVMRLGGDTARLGAEVKRRLITGRAALDGENYDKLYMLAARVRGVIKREYDEALETCDVLVCPTTPTAATELGATRDPIATHFSDAFLSPVSLAGLPAVSVPCGTDSGLPIGLQIIGRRFAERDILNVGKAVMA